MFEKKRGGGGRVIVLQSSAVLASAWGLLQKSVIPFAQGESVFQAMAFRVPAWLTAKCFRWKFLFMFTAFLVFFYDTCFWQLPLGKGLDYKKINGLVASFNFSIPIAFLS